MRITRTVEVNSLPELYTLTRGFVSDVRNSAKTLRQIGSRSLSGGRDYKHGNLTRGLFRLVRDPSARFEILDTIRNLLIYRNIDKNRPFSSDGGTPQTKALGKLIANGSLGTERLKIVDTGCNHGYLADHLLQPVERYIGIDLVKETIERANLEAEGRFRKINCSDYRFVQGDILNKNSYFELPRDNNVVVCTGVAGHFSIRQIALLLENLNEILSDEPNARIYLGYPVAGKPGSKFRKKGLDHDISFEECFSISNKYQLLKFRSYNPDQFERFIESLGFEIDLDNSDMKRPLSNPLRFEDHARTIHLCLKKQKVN